MASRIQILIRAALLLVALAGTLIFLLLLTPWPAEWLRETVLHQASALTGGKLAIGALEIRFFPVRLILREVRFEKSDAAGGEIRIACRKVDLSLPYRAYRGDFSHLEALDLQAPEVFYRRGAAGGAPAAGSLPGPAPLLPVSIGRLAVAEGVLRVEDPSQDWGGELKGLTLTARNPGGAVGTLAGRLEKARLALRVGEHRAGGEVAADFQLAGKRVGLTRIEARDGDGFESTGSLSLDLGPQAPTFQLAARGTLAAAGSPRRLLRDLNGNLEVQAQGEVTREGIRASGTLRSSEISFARLTARQLTARAQFRRGHLEMTEIQAEALGGKLAGDVRLDWAEGAARDALLDANVSLENGGVEAILKFLQIEGVPLDGRVTHRGEYRLKGMDPSTLQASGTVSLAGTLHDLRPEPLNASARLRLDGQTLRVEEGQAGTPTLHARFGGSLRLDGEGSGALRIQVQASNLSHLQRFLDRVPVEVREPVAEIVTDSAGADASFQGDLSWRRRALWLDGQMQSGPLELQGKTLGELSADFKAGPDALEVRRGNLTGGDVVAAAEGEFHGARQFRLKGKVGNLPAAWLRRWSHLDWPVDGRLTADFDLGGRTDSPAGSLNWRLDEPVVASVPMNLAEGSFSFAPDEMTVQRLRVARDAGEVLVTGSLGYHGRPLNLSAEGRGLDLRWFHESGMVPAEIAGPVTLTARLQGTLQQPKLEVEVTTPGATVRGIGAGAITARFSADSQEGALTVVPAQKGINFAGRVLWDEHLTFDGDLILDHFTVPVTSLGADFPVTSVDVALTGGIRVEGELKRPARFDASGNLVKVAVRLGQLTLESQVPAYFRWNGTRLEITPLKLLGSGTDLTLKGVVEPEKEAYHFSAEGSVGLAALASFYPGLIAGGAADVSVSFDASPETRHLEGWLLVHDGRLREAGLPLPITSLEGKLVIDAGGAFHLEGVRFEAGGGVMTVDGKGALRGIQPAALNLLLKGSNVQLLYPEGFRGRYDLGLTLTQDESGGWLSGDINLIRGVYSKDFKIERSLFSLAREEESTWEEGGEAEEETFLSPIKLDLWLRAEKGLWILNDLAKLEGRANLHVSGTVGSPQITGRVSAFEGGIVRFRQVEYEVTRGNIDLVDLDRFNPYFDIAAQTRVRDYEINLKLDGSLEHLEYELTSNPPLSQQDILALLVSGRTLGNLAATGAGGQALEEAAAGALAGPLTQGLGGRLQGVTGLDQFTIDPVILSREGDPASRITVGKQISENLFAAYSSVLGSSSEEIYQLEYQLGRDFKFTSTRDSDAGLGGDLRYVWRRMTGPGSKLAVRPVPKKIEKLTVEGEPGMRPRRLRRLLRLRQGDAMDRGRATAGEERLLAYYHRHDHLQAVVEAREEGVEGRPDRVELVLKVDPGPKVEIQVRGTGSDKKYRRKIRDLWKGSVFPEEIPEEARARLERLLRQAGYYQARVEMTLPEDTAEKRKVMLAATPGTRTTVEKIEITGNQNLSTDDLLKTIRSKPGSRSTLNPEEAKADSGRIRVKYLIAGYPDARVPPPEIVLTPNGSEATLRFQITEGEPVRLKSVRVEGNVSLSAERLLKGLPVQSGDPFLRAKVRSGAEQIRLAYDRAGFADAKVAYELGGPAGTELIYRVEEGKRRTVGALGVEGNLLTRDEVVEKTLTFKPGDPLSHEEILKSQRALYRLGIFQTVDLTEVEGTDPQQPAIRIRVSEADNLIQSVGVGYDSQEGIRGIYDLTDTNLFGRGRSLSLILRGSAVDSRAQVLFKDPYLFSRRLDSLITAYWAHQERESFTEETLGTTLQVSKKLSQADRTFYRYTLKDVDVSDLQVSPAEAGVQSLRLSGPAFALTHDTRDDFFNPRKGTFDTLDVGIVSTALGSDVDYERIYLTGSWFKTVARETVWAQAARAGFLVPYGNTQIIPISERFFAGGDTTVRGFARDQLGPREVDPTTGAATGDPLGGETVFILNEELRFPIWRFLRGVVFGDAGNVTSEVKDFNPLRLRTVMGLGIRINTPIGPFRLEYGWKLDREEGETPGVLQLSIGQAF